MKNFDQLNRPKKPLGFLDIIQGLKERFYTIDEFPFLERDTLPQGILSRAMSISEDQIKDFVFHLKGKELEGLLLDIRDASSLEEIERAIEILAIRSTPRVLKLLTILFQYNYTSPGLIDVLESLSAKIKEKESFNSAEAFIGHLGQEEDKFSALCHIIDSYSKEIDRAFKALNISSESPFAQEAAYKYLICKLGDGYIKNLKWMIRTIESRSAEELRELLTNYLSGLKLGEYHDGINLAILSKLGQPNISPNWAPYEKELRDKFTQWYFLNRLRIHTMSMPKKYKVLSKYYKQVRNSYEIPEENLMIIDFGDIVIADIGMRPYSYFYEKGVFEKEMEAWKKSKEEEENISTQSSSDEGERGEHTSYQPTFLRMDKKSLTARDFMIEEVEEPCIKLSYEGIDILYINEMMDIKIGIEPDMRRKQLAKLRKKVRHEKTGKGI